MSDPTRDGPGQRGRKGPGVQGARRRPTAHKDQNSTPEWSCISRSVSARASRAVPTPPRVFARLKWRGGWHVFYIALADLLSHRGLVSVRASYDASAPARGYLYSTTCAHLSYMHSVAPWLGLVHVCHKTNKHSNPNAACAMAALHGSRAGGAGPSLPPRAAVTLGASSLMVDQPSSSLLIFSLAGFLEDGFQMSAEGLGLFFQHYYISKTDIA